MQEGLVNDKDADYAIVIKMQGEAKFFFSAIMQSHLAACFWNWHQALDYIHHPAICEFQVFDHMQGCK